MSCFVAGVVFFFSILIGVLSYMALPNILQSVGDEQNEFNNISLAAKLTAFFKRENYKQHVVVIALSLCCMITAFLIVSGKDFNINAIRHIALMFGLLSVFIIDYKTHLIPNVLIVILFIIGLLILIPEFVFYRNTFVSKLLSSVIGLLCCIVLFYILSRLTKEGIGMGDVKLIATMGWLIGIADTLLITTISLFVCAVVASISMCVKKKNVHDQVPFGPFMFFGYILVLVLFNL